MTNFAELVPVPAPEDMNSGLTPVTSEYMLERFGVPGHSDPDCGDVTNEKLKPRIVTEDCGPIRVTGFDEAVQSLQRIFAKVHADNPELNAAINTAGMICVRLRRGSNTLWSNHSWGFAIDLYCGDGVVPQGSHQCHAGILALYPYFHEEGWFWGAGFSGGSIDPMHYEYAKETLEKVNF